MGRSPNTSLRRAQITDALEGVLAESGYDGASVIAIARRAGLTPGLVHYHFRNKEEILCALAEAIATRVRNRFERQLASAGHEPRRRLRAFLDALVALDGDGHPHGGTAWISVGHEAMHRPEVAAVYTAFLASVTERLRELVAEVLRAEGRSRRGLVEITAALLAAIHGFHALSVTAREQLPRGSAAPALRRTADGLIDAQPLRTQTA